MSDALYVCSSEGAVALVAATAKTVIGVKAHANSGIDLSKIRLGFDGVTSGAIPVLCELGYCTWATNSPGTNSTSTTPRQVSGRVLTAGFTAGKTWTTEPTVITVVDDFLLSAYNGLIIDPFEQGMTFDSALGEGYVLRLTAPAAVNARATYRVKRI